MATTYRRRHPFPNNRHRRLAIGALVGASPGIVLTIANMLVTTGETQLTFGVVAAALIVAGAVVGAVLAANYRLQVAPAAVGAAIGAVPGIAAFVLPGLTRFAPLILIVGAVAGGVRGNRWNSES